MRFRVSILERGVTHRDIFMNVVAYISHPLRNDLVDRFAMVDVKTFPTGNFELARIEAQLLKDCGMDVGDIMAIFDRVKANFIGRPMNNSSF